MKEMHMNMQTGEVKVSDTRRPKPTKKTKRNPKRSMPLSNKKNQPQPQSQPQRTQRQPFDQAMQPQRSGKPFDQTMQPQRSGKPLDQTPQRQIPSSGQVPIGNMPENISDSQRPHAIVGKKLTWQQKRFLKKRRKQQKKLQKRIKKQSQAFEKNNIGQGQQPPMQQPVHTKKRRLTQNALKRRRRIRRIVTIALSLTFAVVGIFLSINVFFKISDIRIEGECRYGKEEFLKTFNIDIGENMFSFNAKSIAAKMLKKMPYLESLQVRRRLPSTVVFIVQPAIESFVVKKGEEYAVLSQGLRILRMTPDIPETVCFINGLEIKEEKVGQTITAEIPDKIDTVILLLEKLEQTTFLPLSELDISDPYSISFVSNNRLKVVLGTMVDIDYKLKMLDKISAEKLSEDTRAVLDASSTPTTKMVWVKENGF